MSEPLTERDWEMVYARFSGQKLEQIAEDHYMSRERVRQILARCMRRFMLSEQKWVAAEAACRAERLAQWSSMVAAPGELASIAAQLPSMRLTLDDLEVPARVYNVLKYYGVVAIDDICRLTSRDFLRFKNAGRKSLNELRDVLDGIHAPHKLGDA